MEPAIAGSSRTIRVWTAKHVGNLDLLRACLADELVDWVEECRADHGRACDICYCDRWISIPGALPLDYRELVRWPIIISRIEGITAVADKVETEKALARCREAGMPGFELGPASYFPATWLLPEQLKEFKQHVQRKRFAMRGGTAATFIVKPSDGSEGENIRLLRDESKIPRFVSSTLKPAVAQEYLPPLLHEGKKFDLRLYALITSVEPLECFLHSEGLARFCAELYEPPNEENLKNGACGVCGLCSRALLPISAPDVCSRCMLPIYASAAADADPVCDSLCTAVFSHLTNYSLNKQSSSFVHMSTKQLEARVVEAQGTSSAVDISEGGGGIDRGILGGSSLAEAAGMSADGSFSAGSFAGCSKRPCSAVLAELHALGEIEREALWEQIKELTRLTLVALQPELAAQHRQRFNGASTRGLAIRAAAEPCLEAGSQSRRAFHVVGVDVLIDSKGRPRLLEVNSNPSLAIDHSEPSQTQGAEEEEERQGEASARQAAPALARASPAAAAEISPVDLLVKRRVLTDALRIVAAGGGSAAVGAAGPVGFQPIVLPSGSSSAGRSESDGAATLTLTRPLTLVDRCRRLYSSFMKWANPSAGIDVAQFLRFAHRAALFTAPSGPSLDEKKLEACFQKVCGRDEKKLPPHAFSRALVEVSRAAYGGADDDGMAGERLERLLAHVAAHGEMG